MKKSNMLIAVFAVLAAASAAKAEEVKIDFDGGNKGFQAQSMHDIFAAAHNIVPAGALKTDAATDKRVMGGGDDPCCDNPDILCYAPCEPGQTRSANPADFKTLARYYMAQEKIKTAVAEYYTDKGETAAAAGLADKAVRVAAGNGVVYVIRSGSQVKLLEPRLAARIDAIVRPEGQQKIHPGLIIIGACMMDDDCWEAVGDGVSAISEWANS